jgi:hypothetical protein
MKKQQIPFLTLIILLLSFSQLLIGQYTKVEQITIFSTRPNAPIIMDVQTSTDKIVFNAINKSYFPYDFVISFSIFQNLSPVILEQKAILSPGKNRLFDLTIVDKNQSPQYRYSFKYTMIISDNPDLSYPYLIPLARGKTVKLDSVKKDDQAFIYNNRFKMDNKDTVFSIRKGTVTALPDNNIEIDRIIKSSSLEILHKDGTVAVYLGLDPSQIFLTLGQIVYPGQPVGIIGETETLTLHLFSMQESSKLKTFGIYYSDQNGMGISASLINKTGVFHPENIIKKELTPKEIKKMEKRKLY